MYYTGPIRKKNNVNSNHVLVLFWNILHVLRNASGVILISIGGISINVFLLRRQVLQGFTRFCMGFARFSQGFREGLARLLLGFCKFAKSLQWFCKWGARDLQGLARGLQGFCKEFARNLQGFAGPGMDRHGPERTVG